MKENPYYRPTALRLARLQKEKEAINGCPGIETPNAVKLVPAKKVKKDFFDSNWIYVCVPIGFILFLVSLNLFLTNSGNLYVEWGKVALAAPVVLFLGFARLYFIIEMIQFYTAKAKWKKRIKNGTADKEDLSFSVHYAFNRKRYW